MVDVVGWRGLERFLQRIVDGIHIFAEKLSDCLRPRIVLVVSVLSETGWYERLPVIGQYLKLRKLLKFRNENLGYYLWKVPLGRFWKAR